MFTGHGQDWWIPHAVGEFVLDTHRLQNSRYAHKHPKLTFSAWSSKPSQTCRTEPLQTEDLNAMWLEESFTVIECIIRCLNIDPLIMISLLTWS